MSNVLANSYTATGAATAFNRGMSPDRQAERASAYAQKEAADQALRTAQATEPTAKDRQTMADAQSVEIQNALAKQQEMLRESNKRLTYDAFDRYDNGGYDPRHLNTMIDQLKKTGSKLYENIVRVDKWTESDRDTLTKMGIEPALQDALISDPEVGASYVKLTQKDGSIVFGDLDLMKGVTGYNDYASNKELTRQQTLKEIEIMTSLGYDITPDAREAFRRTKAQLGPDVNPRSPAFQEAYTTNYDKVRSLGRGHGRYGSGGGPENKTEKEAEAARRAMLDGFTEGTPEYEQAFSQHMSDINSEWGRPSGMRNMEGAEEARTYLEEELGFWEMDHNALTPRERSKIEPYIRRIEKLAGAELTQADKTQLVRIKELTQLGSAAGALTPEQTGIIDNVLRTLKKYVSDSPEGVQAESAYAAFRNVVKHALYGASLQPGESENFISQFGSMSQQRGPILQQMRNSLEQLKSNYESVIQMNDPMVALWRTGRTGEELVNVIDAFDDRIEMIDKVMKGLPVQVGAPAPVTAKPGHIQPKNRAKMDGYSGRTTVPVQSGGQE